MPLQKNPDYTPVGILCSGGHSENRAMPHWCWVSDFCPFGSIKPATSWVADSMGYRYGLNNMEKDDELKGLGNSYDFGARIYDPRVGRWLAVDPLSIIYIGLSPYCFVANMPIIAIDPDGEKIVIVYRDESGKKQKIEYQPGMTYEGDNKFVQQTVASLNHKHETDVLGVIETIADKNFATVRIKHTDNTSKYKATSFLFFTLHTIEWNPHQAMAVLDDEGEKIGAQTPATGLIHELGHPYVEEAMPIEEQDKMIEEFDSDPSNIERWDNPADMFIIRNIENPSLDEFETPRGNYEGRPINVSDPFSIEEKSEYSNEQIKL